MWLSDKDWKVTEGRCGMLQQELGAGTMQKADLRLSQLWEQHPQSD